MKKILIRIVVLVLVFAAAVFGTSKILGKKMADTSEVMAQATFPLVYVDLNGKPSMDIRFNPNTSMEAIEGITSPDGRVLGKMGHSERIGFDVCKNVTGIKDQGIFENGVRYFK